jgi:hypothetical protein
VAAAVVVPRWPQSYTSQFALEHPNREAHEVEAQEIEPGVCTSLGIGATCDRQP